MKCDGKECGNEAFLRLRYPLLEVQVNVCPFHYEQMKKLNPRWEGVVVEEIHDPASLTQP